MKHKIKMTFDIDIDYPTIKENKKVAKSVKQCVSEWVSWTNWSDFIPMFYDQAHEDEEYPYYAKVKFNIKAQHNNKTFINNKWTEDEDRIIEGATTYIPLKNVKKAGKK